MTRNEESLSRWGLTPELEELAALRLGVPEQVTAATAPESLDRPWYREQAEELADEQLELHDAAGVGAARGAEVTRAGLDRQRAVTDRLVDKTLVSAEAAADYAQRTAEALGPWVRRRPHGSVFYWVCALVLIGGDIAGCASAAIMWGEVPILAVCLAVSVGSAAMLSGAAGAGLRRAQGIKERASDLERLPEALWPYAALFSGNTAGHGENRSMTKLAWAIVITVAVGVFGLRHGLDGITMGLAYAGFSVAVALGSWLNNWVYEDVVADTIENAHTAASRELKKAKKLARDASIRRHDQAKAQATSVLAEFAHQGEAAAHKVMAVCHLTSVRNPAVMGHGPARGQAGASGRRRRQVEPSTRFVDGGEN